MRTRAAVALAPLLLVFACSSAPAGRSASTGSAIDGFPGCSGLFDTQPNPTGSYFATDFGCSSNPYFTDPGDTCGSASCIQSAYDEGVCDGSQSNADCQRAVNWYSVGGAIFGCGARLQVTNPANDKSVVVMVLDDGPNCRVENDANFWVLDVSYPTIMYLFGSEEGWKDTALIDVAEVASSTPLGPSNAPPVPAPAPPSGGGNEDAGTYCVVSSTQQSGVCISTSDCAAIGSTSVPGNCPGASDIQCCVSTGCNADSQCTGNTTCVGGQCQ